MDVNDLRSAVTLFSLLLFLAIAAWNWSRSQRPQHEAAAQLPFLDEESEGGAAAAASPKGVNP